MSDYFRTQYERLYEGSEYYWGTEPADFLRGIADRYPREMRGGVTVLDIGCGEGKDAVYMAEQGFSVTAFDITESGIRKTRALARERGVAVEAFTADVNDFTLPGTFDIIYSTGTIQYLRDEKIDGFFEKVKGMTRPGGLNYFNVFVEKPFLPLPPDWDREEKMWRTGRLFAAYADWELVEIDERIFEDMSGGAKHFHCMDTMLARKPK